MLSGVTVPLYREYTLSGSYRKILHLPKEISWSLLRYTDPDVPLAQADEDSLLGFDPPALIEDGKFMALQIHLVLGTAVYATMALREITKMDTSSHVQSNLTVNAEDQVYRGSLPDETETMEEAVA
jgi:tRNA pseudouridine13 synthase